MKTAAKLQRFSSTPDTYREKGWAPLLSNDHGLHQLKGLDAPKSSPKISPKVSVEAIQMIFALFDAVIILIAAALLVPTFNPFTIALAFVGTGFFILGKALMRGYSRSSLS
jgi:hypothetical protein